MILIIDSREQKIDHILKYFNSVGQQFIYKKLDFGDYSIAGFENQFAIERKNGLLRYGGGFNELKNNLCTQNGRLRFYKEFQKAANSGAEMVLLIENAEDICDILTMKNSLLAANYVSNQAYFNIFNQFFVDQQTIRAEKLLNPVKLEFSKNGDTGRKIIELINEYLNKPFMEPMYRRLEMGGSKRRSININKKNIKRNRSIKSYRIIIKKNIKRNRNRNISKKNIKRNRYITIYRNT